MVKSFPSFRQSVTSKARPTLALATLIVSSINMKDVASISLLFIDIVIKVIKNSISLSRHTSLGRICC